MKPTDDQRKRALEELQEAVDRVVNLETPRLRVVMCRECSERPCNDDGDLLCDECSQ